MSMLDAVICDLNGKRITVLVDESTGRTAEYIAGELIQKQDDRE